MDRKNEALKLVEKYCFSLFIRLHCVELFRTKQFKEIPGILIEESLSINDTAVCLAFIKETHPKNVMTECDTLVNFLKVYKKNFNKIQVLGIKYLKDQIIQLQFLTLLEPIIESELSENFYGFRKERNSLQALAFLSKSIQSSEISNFFLISVSIGQCFNSISHEFIQKQFPFPIK